MSLLEKQQRFTECLGKLISYAYSRGYKLTMSDGSIDPIRKYLDENGAKKSGRDTYHLVSGCHYKRLAQDLNLFVNGAYIRGEHPAWEDLGKYWLTLDNDSRWGGLFAHRDYNHVSFQDGGSS